MAAKFRVLNAGTLREIKTLYVMQGGVRRRVRTLKVMHGDVLRTVGVFAQPLSVSATSSLSSNPVGNPPTVMRHIAQAYAVPTGGAAPFTYIWTLTHGGGWASSTLTTAVLGLTSITAIGEGPPSATYSVTVTDAVGQSATTSVSF